MGKSELIKHLTEANFGSEIEKGVTLVDFHADWCGPCRMLAPELETVAEDLQGNVQIGKLDIDAEAKIAGQYQVTSVPTMIVFKDGKEVNRIVGLRDAAAIKEFLEQV